jgi:hypothetical protein
MCSAGRFVWRLGGGKRCTGRRKSKRLGRGMEQSNMDAITGSVNERRNTQGGSGEGRGTGREVGYGSGALHAKARHRRGLRRTRRGLLSDGTDRRWRSAS